MSKRAFLVVYDYETGGVWAVIFADNQTQIEAKYPRLKIVSERPNWMTDSAYKKIIDTFSFDIDAEPHGWLRGFAPEQNR